MKTALTITDLTRMQGDRVCVAGYLPDNLCVRPFFQNGGLTERWLHVNGEVAIRPFAIIEFDLQGVSHRSVPPHTEDWIIDPLHRIHQGMLSPEERAEWFDKMDDGGMECIFGTMIYHEHGTYVLAGKGTRSLGTIQVRRIEEVQFNVLDNGRWNYRLIFTDQSGQRFRLPVTDLAFRTYLNYLRDERAIPSVEIAQSLTATLQRLSVFLRIGLARGWDQFPDRCYVQITGVFSFPDYLSGRCFADFASPILFSEAVLTTSAPPAMPSVTREDSFVIPAPLADLLALQQGIFAKLLRRFRTS